MRDRAPGRSTLVEQIAGDFQSNSGPREGPVDATAARGFGTGAALPFAGRIQAAFGRHDVSDVRAHVGGSASEACRELGAQAYTMGTQVAFKSSPDLHLAAHEAAHVVQQRGGVQLKGGIGAPGDPHERHADAVADAVVRGQSAESMLDGYAGGSAVQRAVQLSPEAAASDPSHTPAANGSPRRKVITFIMGSDEPARIATGFWSQPGKSDVVVTKARTFVEILSYLHKNPPPNQAASKPSAGAASKAQPWGEINIVAHGNDQGTLAFALREGAGPQMAQKQLQEEVDAGRIQALPDTIIDHQTHINVLSCSLGRSPEMLQTLSQAFGGADREAPLVHGSVALQAYSVKKYADGTKVYGESLSEYWSIGFPEGKRWGLKQIADAFTQQYGAVEGIDWATKAKSARRLLSKSNHAVRFAKPTKIPRQNNIAAHRALLSSDKDWASAAATWSQFTVASQQITAGIEKNRPIENIVITYAYTKPKAGGGTQTGRYTISFMQIKDTQKWTDEERNAWLPTVVGTELDQYSWTFSVRSTKEHDEVLVKGRRTVIRIEREVRDAAGKPGNPSRTDHKYYHDAQQSEGGSYQDGTFQPAKR